MNGNYIGITGFKTVNEIQEILNHFNALKRGTDHVLMIGLLISPRNLDNQWASSRYPRLDEFSNLIEASHGHAFTTLHIDAKNTSSWKKDLELLCNEIDVNGIDGFQINVKHPEIEDIRDIKKKFNDKDIIMQYSDDFISSSIGDARNEMYPYIGFINHVLIDPSRGRGVNVNIDKAIEHYLMLVNDFNLNVGFAGGFNPENIEKNVEKIKSSIGNTKFSIDVETGVRNDHDNLSIDLAKKYLSNICTAIN